MVEALDNGIQLLVMGACALLAFRKAQKADLYPWAMLGMFFGCFFLGDLYWFTYYLFMGNTPRYSFISEVAWYAAYLFLFLLMRQFSTEEERSCRASAVLAGPVFAAGAAVYFVVSFGDIYNNLICALLMSMLLWVSVRGLIYIKRSGTGTERRYLYLCVFGFCVLEYVLWFVSCFWMGDTFANPYFWIDFLISAFVIQLLFAVRKAARE